MQSFCKSVCCKDCIFSKEYAFSPEYGVGSYKECFLDGLYISLVNVSLTQELNVVHRDVPYALALSFLIDGVKIIKSVDSIEDVMYEAQESYLVYLNQMKETFCCIKNKHYKEIRILMDADFLKRHHLNNEDVFCDKKASTVLNDFILPICCKSQDALTELMSLKLSGKSKELFLVGKVLELLALYLDKSKKENREQVYNDELSKKLEKVKNIISSDLTAQFTTTQLSRIVGLNNQVLKKQFEKTFRQSIHQFFLQIRMEKTVDLLLHSTKPINEISDIVGYKNSTHFIAAFKKKMKKTPKKFREINSGFNT
ncbi:AraC family transcriptional regulator [Flavobacterium sp. LS1R49]|uniref:AraC family transcriptional regulator n=2 Tax=Flavobacterium shii TaxID=2987687 RepID=A0A9X2YVJ1_9FLAO|nr:AraC family transcriptional regulator [Flavobacterium shii]